MATGTGDTSSAKPANNLPSATSYKTEQPMSLPEVVSDSKAVKLDVSSGEGVKLGHLGPMVVNRDGTLSRIANWEEMTDMERKNTLRILGKRNQLRLETLQSEEDAPAAAQ